jgi:hypothetical protein
MPESKSLEQILQSLVGSHVAISYVHTPGSEESLISGILEQVSKDVIQVKDRIMGSPSTVWINRHNSVLTTVRLLQGKKKRKVKV